MPSERYSPSDDLDALEASARAATPGPWSRFYGGEPFEIGVQGKHIASVHVGGGEHAVNIANAKFIAGCSPGVVLALVARLRAAEAVANAAFDLRRMATRADEREAFAVALDDALDAWREVNGG